MDWWRLRLEDGSAWTWKNAPTASTLDGMSEFVFGPDEQADFASTRGREKFHLFFTLWTLKEALIKALGTGFSLDPARFEAPQAMRRGARKGMFRFPHMPDVVWRPRESGQRGFRRRHRL